LLQQGFAGDIRRLVDTYWDSIEKMIRAGGFDIVGHLDLIKKNNTNDKWFSEDEAWYRRRTEHAAQLLGDSGLVVEVNTGGLNRGKTRDTYPSLEILRLLRKKNVPVMINADAHTIEQLGGHYETAVQTLREAGYTEIAYFDAAYTNKWRSDPL
jgi:histidinol-phosphatase (PHP family)